MSFLYKAIGLAALFGFHSLVNAATLNGVLEGGELRWTNGQLQGDYIALTNWTPMNNGLVPTDEWVPGTFLGTPASTITFSGPGGDVSVSMTVAGLNYALGQSSQHFTERGDPMPGLSPCSISKQSATVELIGANCVAKDSYKTDSVDKKYTPFQFIRPILEADSDAIVQAFRDAELTSGTYTGMLVVQPVYYFKSPTGSWTYRTAKSVVTTVRIRYEAASLENLIVRGDGVIPPEYDTLNHRVSGKTYFDVLATGYFTEGVVLTLDDIPYELEYESDNSITIPYSITCVGNCEHTDLVSSGKLSNESTIITGGENRVHFRLRVHYDNIEVNQVETGQYNDQFVIYVEEAL